MATSPDTPAKKTPDTASAVRPAIRRLVWVRRLCQAAFFGLFCWLLTETTFRGSFSSAAEQVRMSWPVEAFVFADPFVALLALLSTHTVYRGLLWSLGIVVLTVVFGRVFCGWICPLGTLNHFISWLFPSRHGRGSRRVEQNKTRPVRQRVKYYLLYASVGAAVVGSGIGGVLDPICLAIRGIGLAVLPVAQYAAGSVADAARNSGIGPLETVAGGLADLLSSSVGPTRQPYVHVGWLIAVLFVIILVLNRFVPRFWCRVLCPLGALLGLLSRFSLFGMRKRSERCTDCNLCLNHCQGADSPQGGAKWRQDECHMCLNCEAACPEAVIRFGFLPDRHETTRKPDTERRTALAAAAAGVALIPITRTAASLEAAADERVIRPPGAVDEKEFLARCVRCGECMKVCPNNAVHPAMFEAGLEGLWTPILIPRMGHCEQPCTLCGQVCPTGAISELTHKEKVGRPVRLGQAFIDRGRCLPWAMDTPCIVCEEVCPTSPKAIHIREVEVENRDGESVTLQRPYVDPTHCVGCGLCEARCPVNDLAAIRVSSVGETRDPENRMIILGGSV